MNLNDHPSPQVILQRVRNRIMEYFELVADPNCLAMLSAASVINMWEDWRSEPVSPLTYPDPVFNVHERDVMIGFDHAWELAADSTPDPMPEVHALRSLPAWQQLIDSAKAALSVFEVRGRLSEEEEASPDQLARGREPSP